MKILTLIPGMNGGGAEKQFLYFSKRLQQSYPDTRIAVFYRNKYEDLISELNLNIITLNNHGFRNPKNIIELNKFIQNENISVVISFLPVADLYMGLIKMCSPSIYWLSFERNSFPQQNIIELARRFLIQYLANGILSNSLNGLRYWSKFQGTKIFYPNHIPKKKNTSLESKNIDTKIDFLFAGRFAPQKNVLKIAEIFKEISESYTCMMIGEGELTDEVRKISNNKFEIKSFQDNIYDYYRNSKVFVNLSKHEGLPNTVIENLVLGKKIILSDIPEHRDLVGDDYPFFIKLNETKLSDKFIRILHNNEKNANRYFIHKYISREDEYHQILLSHLNTLDENFN